VLTSNRNASPLEGRSSTPALAVDTSPLTRPSASPGAASLPVATLSNSLLEEGEAVAALAVSELLGSQWPLITTTLPSPPCLSPPISRRCDSDSGGAPSVGSSEDAPCERAERQEGTGSRLQRVSTWGQYLSSQPMTVVVVLLASHAAALLLGLAIGRGRAGVAPSPAAEYMLQRRFSSGPYGMHARLCSA